MLLGVPIVRIFGSQPRECAWKQGFIQSYPRTPQSKKLWIPLQNGPFPRHLSLGSLLGSGVIAFDDGPLASYEVGGGGQPRSMREIREIGEPQTLISRDCRMLTFLDMCFGR